MKRLRWILICPVLILYGCVKESNIDRDPPIFNILSWSPTPTEGNVCGTIEQFVFNVGTKDTIMLLIEFEDAGGLSEAKIDIHNNFDCHGHRSITQDWFLQQIINLNGTNDLKSIALPVPENPTAGVYHFGLQVSDISGNVTDQSFFYSIRVLNYLDTIAPELIINSPLTSNINVKRGEQLAIDLVLRDNLPLNEGGNSKFQILARRVGGGNLQTLLDLNFNSISSTEYHIDTSVTIPITWVRTEYELLLIGWDGVRNESNIHSLKLDVQ